MRRRQDSDEARDWQQHFAGDSRARERLILKHAHLVFKTRLRLFRNIVIREDVEDICGAGHIALILAVDTFDQNLGVEFASHAIGKIRWAMLDWQRLNSPIPRSVFERRRMFTALEQSLGERYSPTEITDPIRARHLGLNLDKFYRLKDSCDYPERDIGQAWDEEQQGWINPDTWYELAVDPHSVDLETQVAEKMLLDIVRTALTWLPKREQRVIEWRYWRELTYVVTAERMQLCESRVHQLHWAGIGRLRTMLAPLGAHL